MQHAMQKYLEERLPRYTSYPTANVFANRVGGELYRDWLSELGPEDPVSVYVHVPFCRSMCWYCGCHTKITRQDTPLVNYRKALESELSMVARELKKELPLGHLHFGGGTPTIIGATAFRELMERIRGSFSFETDAEIAVEIDPRTFGEELSAALGEAGVNRASLGVQSFDLRVQEAIGRIQSADQTREAVALLRNNGITGINFDLIYGLPRQTRQSCRETVKLALEMQPDRFSVFGYAHLPGFKTHQKMINETELPGGLERHEQAEAIAETLLENGYRQIGIDHFALPGDELTKALEKGELHRNFQGYTTDPCETLLAFGASAISRLPSGFCQNEVSIGQYMQRIENGELAVMRGHVLSERDRLQARIIERLMCDYRLDFSEIPDMPENAAEKMVSENPVLGQIMQEGLIDARGSELEIQPHARFIVRKVASCFDDYLGSTGSTHSKAA